MAHLLSVSPVRAGRVPCGARLLHPDAAIDSNSDAASVARDRMGTQASAGRGTVSLRALADSRRRPARRQRDEPQVWPGKEAARYDHCAPAENGAHYWCIQRYRVRTDAALRARWL